MSKFNSDMIRRCADWVRENGLMDCGGAKLKDFCADMGIDAQTYYRWCENADFADAIKKAKDDFRDKTERDIVESLANAAKGYEYTEVRSEYKGAQLVRRTKTTKHVEPNVGAAIFLLTNIAPERWKNRQRQDVDITTGGDKVAFNGFNFLPYTPGADKKDDDGAEDKHQAAAGV